MEPVETYTKFHLALAFIMGVGVGVYIDIYILDGYYKQSLKIGFDELKRQYQLKYQLLFDKKCQECDKKRQNDSNQNPT